jgi:tetratricopeptide (TPR) repeat protein
MEMTTLILVVALMLGIDQSGAAPAGRFDLVVRTDFFAGFAGDEARLRRGMDACEQILATNPRHAEALVWHGSGLLFQAGAAFASGNTQRGSELVGKGLEEMNRAAALEPDNVGVLIPQAAVLLVATRNMPADAARPLIEQAVGNYEKVLTIQAPYFSTLGDHPKGELLFGLAEGYSRLGKPDLARRNFERLIKDAPQSGQAPRARMWLDTGSIPKSEGVGCVGCHK